MNKIDILGIEFDNVTKDDAVSFVLDRIAEHSGGYMVTPNPEIVMQAWSDPELRAAVSGAKLAIPDGIGIVYAANILKTPIKERVPGIDVAASVFENMAQKGKSVFLLGAMPGVAEKAAENMQQRYPGLEVCGIQDGYFKDDKPVIDMINAAKPDFLLVCLGAPKQELWMAKHEKELDVGFMGGLGGTLDVFAGIVKRAPQGWQDSGLEWLYRCVKEPRRFKRVVKLPSFMFKAIGERIRKAAK